MQSLRNWRDAVRKRKFNLLFICLLVLLVLYPYVQEDGTEHFAFRIFASCVALFTVYIVSFRRAFALVALGLAIPTLFQRFWPPVGNVGTLLLVFTSCS